MISISIVQEAVAGFIVISSPVLTHSYSFQLTILSKSVEDPDFAYLPARFGIEVEGSAKKASEILVLLSSFLKKLLFTESITIVVWPIYQLGNEYGLRANKVWPSSASAIHIYL